MNRFPNPTAQEARMSRQRRRNLIDSRRSKGLTHEHLIADTKRLVEGQHKPKPKYREVGKYNMIPTFDFQTGDTYIERTHQRTPLGDSTYDIERVWREGNQPKKQRRKERVLAIAHNMTPRDTSTIENLPARPLNRVLQGRGIPMQKKKNPWIEHVKSFAIKHKMKYREAMMNPMCRSLYLH